MSDAVTSVRGTGRSILIGPRLSDIEPALRAHALDVMMWPPLAIHPAESSDALHEAIENLFGYDWLIFINVDAVRFFLERLIKEGHEVSEIDALRVCAIGEQAAAALEQSQVHVDVFATAGSATCVLEQIADYTGGRQALSRLNFLIPHASIGREYPKDELEAAGARADVIVAYQTVAGNDATRLAVLQTLLLADSIDAVAFADQGEVEDFARIFATNDLTRLLKTPAVFIAAQQPATIAAQLGVPSAIQSSSKDAMVEALIKRFAI
jgi:uroporphyrinogen-III synthase